MVGTAFGAQSSTLNWMPDTALDLDGDKTFGFAADEQNDSFGSVWRKVVMRSRMRMTAKSILRKGCQFIGILL